MFAQRCTDEILSSVQFTTKGDCGCLCQSVSPNLKRLNWLCWFSASICPQALSERFNGEIAGELVAHSCFFPDEYFTCPSLCLSCGWVLPLSSFNCNLPLSFLVANILMLYFPPRSGCKNSMNHLGEGLCHEAKHRCRYSVQYDNRIYTCKVSRVYSSAGPLSLNWASCLYRSLCTYVIVGLLRRGKGSDGCPKDLSLLWLSMDGPRQVRLVWVSFRWMTCRVIELGLSLAYVWLTLPYSQNLRYKFTFMSCFHWVIHACVYCVFRYVIECPNCGVIYRSRQYWYGNQDPVDTVVRTEIQHVWPGVRETSFLSHLSYVDYFPIIVCHHTALWSEMTLYLLHTTAWYNRTISAYRRYIFICVFIIGW